MHRRTEDEKDAALDAHDESIRELRGEVITIRDHVTLLQGRIGSYADAELAYRNAEGALKRMHADHADEHAKMLNSAKKILDHAVEAAIEPFEEPLKTVAAIRQAQELRHEREAGIAEDRLRSQQARDAALSRYAKWLALFLAAGEAVRLLKGFL